MVHEKLYSTIQHNRSWTNTCKWWKFGWMEWAWFGYEAESTSPVDTKNLYQKNDLVHHSQSTLPHMIHTSYLTLFAPSIHVWARFSSILNQIDAFLFIKYWNIHRVLLAQGSFMYRGECWLNHTEYWSLFTDVNNWPNRLKIGWKALLRAAQKPFETYWSIESIF